MCSLGLDVAEALGLSPTQVKEINRRLIELGLVTMKDSPNGKRMAAATRRAAQPKPTALISRRSPRAIPNLSGWRRGDGGACRDGTAAQAGDDDFLDAVSRIMDGELETFFPQPVEKKVIDRYADVWPRRRRQISQWAY